MREVASTQTRAVFREGSRSKEVHVDALWVRQEDEFMIGDALFLSGNYEFKVDARLHVGEWEAREFKVDDAGVYIYRYIHMYIYTHIYIGQANGKKQSRTHYS